MREGAVLADEKFVLVRVIEAALAGGEALRNLNREADGFVDVRNMCGARRATGNLRLATPMQGLVVATLGCRIELMW